MAMRWHAKVLTIKATDEPAPALSAIRASALLIDIAETRDTNGIQRSIQGSNGAFNKKNQKFQQSSAKPISGSRFWPSPSWMSLCCRRTWPEVKASESLQLELSNASITKKNMATMFKHAYRPIIFVNIYQQLPMCL